ncbi:MAG: hypothetical protein HY403_08970 [Elusimicrobia bacterium]|nr:hypothetical protein [Elusimicrobiota bacterium]
MNGLFLCVLASLWLAPLSASAGLLTGQGVAILDQTGAQRTTFSTNEKIGFTQIINNGVASVNRITFQFSVLAPNGNTVFRHAGNSVGGTVGNAASQINGLPVSGFFQGPGVYTLKALASLDGVALEQTQTFTLSSPNLLLIYPPNGSRNLTDNPLSFQWYSSGAVSYRVTVGDNASLYNALFIQTTSPGASSLTYPQNPSDPRQRLSTGQTYWWKVEGLDVNGNVVATSQVPYSFSVANTSLTRDLAVTGLDVAGPTDSAGNIPFRVTVLNQGNTTETNTLLRVTLGGLTAPGTPITIPMLSPADTLSYNVSAPIPTDMNEGLAIACLTIFDDSVGNNCKTLSVSRPPTLSTGAFAQDCASVGGEQVWMAIRQIMHDQGINLDDYAFTGMDGSLSCAELSALLDQLRHGQARASLSGPPLPGTVVPTPTVAAAASEPEEGAAPPVELEQGEEPAAAEEQPKTVVKENTWAGVTPPLSNKTAAFLIKSQANWRRLWRRLSDEPVPLIDFAEHMVVAVLAGGGDAAARVEIEDMSSLGSTLKVRYRLIAHARLFGAESAQAAPASKPAPYMLVAVPRTSLKVHFVKIKESPDENE